MSMDGMDVQLINNKNLNIKMLVHLKILKEEKTGKKKNTSKK